MKWMRFVTVGVFALLLGVGSLTYTACGGSTDTNNNTTQDGGTTKDAGETQDTTTTQDEPPTSRPGG
ncbi:MAG: hypothetical protein EP343_28080 [Deltaproteobacteria bacterium]|nr:MAG: hypothetical protein EP343_28080 [Deltaproteobacteria bacterium]